MGKRRRGSLFYSFLLGFILFLFVFVLFIRIYRTSEESHRNRGNDAADDELFSILRILNYRTRKNESRSVDCVRILEGDERSFEPARAIEHRLPRTPSASFINAAIFNLTCNEFLTRVGFDANPPTSQRERDFPLAFTILIYDEHPEQVFRMIRALYRPQNVFCLHIDAKASKEIFFFYAALNACIPGVLLSPQRFDVVYESTLRLEAEVECMKHLLQAQKAWKYLINFAGSEFPLRTNEEMVRILDRYNGQNDIEGFPADYLSSRWKLKWIMKDHKLQKTTETHPPPPHGLTIVKGSAYGAFTRQFLDFVMKSAIAQDFLKWGRDTKSPDEIYWSTLQYNTQLRAPGGSLNGAVERSKSSWRVKWANWLTKNEPVCHGTVRHALCVFDIGDIVHLHGLQWFAVNKFDVGRHRFALECVEEWHLNRTRHQLHHGVVIDMSAYPLSLHRL